MLLLKGARTFAPKDLGSVDILVGAGEVLAIESGMGPMPVEGGNARLIRLRPHAWPYRPHVHFAGAGGEGGPLFRAEPLSVSSLLESGITTAIGLLGTDGYARSVMEVLRAPMPWKPKDIDVYIYRVIQDPVGTITGDVAVDIMAVEKVLVEDCHSRSSLVPSYGRRIYTACFASARGRDLEWQGGDIPLARRHLPDPFPLCETNKRTSYPAVSLPPDPYEQKRDRLEEALKFASREETWTLRP